MNRSVWQAATWDIAGRFEEEFPMIDSSLFFIQLFVLRYDLLGDATYGSREVNENVFDRITSELLILSPLTTRRKHVIRSRLRDDGRTTD